MPIHPMSLKCPPKARQTAELISQYLGKVLEEIGFSGKWQLALHAHIGQRFDHQLQVIRTRGNTIWCKVRPGDQSTAWEVFLTPPPEIDLEAAFTHLVRQATPSVVGSEIRRLTPVSSLPPNLEASQEAVILAHDVSFSDLTLETKLTDISDSPLALKKSLLAVAIGIDKVTGHVLRKTAMDLLVQELKLDAFVREHPDYHSAVKAAAVLVQGLCNKSYLSRWSCPQRKQARVRETTKGYILTPLGRSQIEMLRLKLAPTLLSRLFKPETVVALDLVEDEPEAAPSDEGDMSRLQTLLNQMRERNDSIVTCGRLMEDCRQSIKDATDALGKAQKRLKEIEAEKLQLQSEELAAQKKLVAAKTNLSETEALLKEEQAALSLVRNQMRNVI